MNYPVIIFFVILDILVQVYIFKTIFKSFKDFLEALSQVFQTSANAYFYKEQNERMDGIIKFAVCFSPLPILVIWELFFLGYIKI